MGSGSNSTFAIDDTLNVSVFNVNVTETDNSTESTTWDNREIARIIHVIVRPTLVVFGSIGNTLSFYVMRRTSLKHLSTCFYMSILALADTGECFPTSVWSGLCLKISDISYWNQMSLLQEMQMFHSHIIAKLKIKNTKNTSESYSNLTLTWTGHLADTAMCSGELCEGINSGGSRIFPRGWDNSQKCYYLSNFCLKLHENERNWTRRGWGGGGVHVSLAPPLRSIND